MEVKPNILKSIVNMINIISKDNELKKYVINLDTKIGFYRDKDKRKNKLFDLVIQDNHTQQSFERCIRACNVILILLFNTTR